MIAARRSTSVGTYSLFFCLRFAPRLCDSARCSSRAAAAASVVLLVLARGVDVLAHDGAHRLHARVPDDVLADINAAAVCNVGEGANSLEQKRDVVVM